MAAKRKYPAPKPRLDLPWSELTRARQNALYTLALHTYGKGEGPNPKTSGDFTRNQVALEAKS
jgi:hypothetical protein